MSEFVLEMRGISKRYGDNNVLKDVNLSIKPGEIHALLGENGAGKSTLMNILFGMPTIHQTGGYEGEIAFNGKISHIVSPQQAIEAGIGMVHQEFMLLPGFTITENIKLNRELSKPNLISRVFGPELEFLDEPTMKSDARAALDRVGISLSEDTRVKTLPVGYMQFVEIAREIDKKGIKLLVFDEPTAVLTESEADRLIEVMQSLSRQGIAIIFITHRLGEVIRAAQSVTVLRDGKKVAYKQIEETNQRELAALMIGHSEFAQDSDAKAGDGTPPKIALEIKNLNVDMPGERVRSLDLEVYEGEILGIGGLAGQGKVGIPNGIMGICESSGEVRFFGEKFVLNSPKSALARGLAMVSEDRRGVGLLLDQSIEDNIAFSAMQVHGDFLMKGPFELKSRRQIRAFAQEMIKLLDIRATSPAQLVGTLSGGNQQKVCIARALALKPRFLFVSEPTRGIDIGAKQLVIDSLRRLNREQGLTIVMVSSELLELRSLCDRIAIVTEGKISAILPPNAGAEEFGLAMSGELGKEMQA